MYKRLLMVQHDKRREKVQSVPKTRVVERQDKGFPCNVEQWLQRFPTMSLHFCLKSHTDTIGSSLFDIGRVDL